MSADRDDRAWCVQVDDGESTWVGPVMTRDRADATADDLRSTFPDWAVTVGTTAAARMRLVRLADGVPYCGTCRLALQAVDLRIGYCPGCGGALG